VKSSIQVRSILLFFFFVLPSFLLAETTALAPAAGDGSSESPYQISSLAELRWVSETSSSWNKDFVITADIDAAETSTWNDGEGFSPIGNTSTRFSGGFANADSFVIANLVINRPSASPSKGMGLFGNIVHATIKDIALEGVNVRGGYQTGGLVGAASSSSIIRCHVTGTVRGDDTGGLVGSSNNSSIIESYVLGTIRGGSVIGGLVGDSGLGGGRIIRCYVIGSVQGAWGAIGGLIGRNGWRPYRGFDLISESYTAASIIGSGSQFGAFIGEHTSGELVNNFYDISVSGIFIFM